MQVLLGAHSIVLLAVQPLAPCAEDAVSTIVSLPAPKTDGKVSVEAALTQRRSVRYFAPVPLTLEEISQLCWAAQGVTDKSTGHRTAPSARAIYPLELYVAVVRVSGLSPCLYHCRPASHSLQLVALGDKRADLDLKAAGQSWNPLTQAAVVFVISGNVAKTGSSAYQGPVSHVLQSVFQTEHQPVERPRFHRAPHPVHPPLGSAAHLLRVVLLTVQGTVAGVAPHPARCSPGVAPVPHGPSVAQR